MKALAMLCLSTAACVSRLSTLSRSSLCFHAIGRPDETSSGFFQLCEKSVLSPAGTIRLLAYHCGGNPRPGGLSLLFDKDSPPGGTSLLFDKDSPLAFPNTLFEACSLTCINSKRWLSLPRKPGPGHAVFSMSVALLQRGCELCRPTAEKENVQLLLFSNTFLEVASRYRSSFSAGCRLGSQVGNIFDFKFCTRISKFGSDSNLDCSPLIYLPAEQHEPQMILIFSARG